MKIVSVSAVSAAIALAALFAALPARADEHAGSQTLKGLKGVQVVVEEIAPDLASDGVTKEAIAASVESQLKDAGIKVLSEDGWKSDPSHPYVYVRVNSMKSVDSKFYAFSLDVELHQDVNLVRNVGVDTLAATWETGSFGIFEIAHADQIYGAVDKEIGEFIADFRTQNGITPSTPGVRHHSPRMAKS